MFIAAVLLSLVHPALSPAFSVSQFHPQGTVRSPRQVRAVFSEPMIPFGDPRGLEPFTVKCSVEGKGLWEDSRTWMYEFKKELPAGESCLFSGKKDLKSDKGSAWQGKSDFNFETGGPAVKRSNPHDGSTVIQLPAFLLHLDGAVDSSSVEKNAYLLVEGMSERIPVRVLAKEVRDEIIKEEGRHRYYYGDEGAEEEGEAARDKNAFTIAVESSRNLPPGKRIQLVWGKGIRSPKGFATKDDQLLAFRTQDPFSVSFHCQRENEDVACLPMGEMSLHFTAPVPRKDVEKVLVHAGNFREKPEINGKEDFVQYLRFKGPFPPSTKFFVEVPGGIQDETGRVLTNAKSFPLEVSTSSYPPLAKFAAPFGILEAQDPVLPVTLRNVEAKLGAARVIGSKVSIGMQDPAKLMSWVFRLHSKHDNYIRWEGEKQIDTRGDSLLAGEAGVMKFDLPKPNGPEAFEVVGIPLGEKGFHVVELESKLLGQSLMGQPKAMFVAAGALVTNFGVHLKWGSESSLVWVTTLDEGKPVKGARVRAADCTGKILWQGQTDESGTVTAEDFPRSTGLATCQGSRGEGYQSGLVVVADKEGDFSFVYSGWDNGIEGWRFHMPMGSEGDETMVHTVFDRSLFRAGQTMHMKHFLRERFLRGIRFSKALMPKSLVLINGSGKKIVFPLTFSGAGTAENDWKIPKDAELGTYSAYLTNRDESAAAGKNGQEEGFQSWGPGVYRSGSIRVEEFRLPVMAGSLQWPKGSLVGPSSVPVDLSVRYLSGGGAAGLGVKLRSRAEKLEGIHFPEFEGYTFAAGNVKAGRIRRGGDEKNNEGREKVYPDQKLLLDHSGGARAILKDLPLWDQPYRLAVEAEYRDPNGEVQTVSRSTTTYPSQALVGLAPDGWVAMKDKVKFHVAVATPEGKPLAGRKVNVKWLDRQNFSHRKRIVGGFYAYENFEEISEKGQACKGSTDAKGLLLCEGTAPASGNMILVAELEEGGHASRSFIDLYVAGGEDWWFSQENDDRIDLLPEKKAYEGGETARFQVRSPFRKATALVTVEREGVIDRYVQEIDGKNPVIELPVKDSYAPNVFVSALLVRGRVGDPKATALVDLARPSHKLGMVAIQVGWKTHRLKVSVNADKTEYKVREKAKVKVSVIRAIDGKPASKGEVLLAAVDEALLELMPNKSWDLLEAMMGERTLKVRTSTAQSQVIGKRHFGLKALPPGGGGGRSSARELFDTLLFWKATIPLNSKGEAEAEVPMNDSLSSFRLVAVASEEADRFGTGSQSVRTRQDLMLFSGVSPLARHGDKTFPEITVRNAGEKALKAEVQAKADGVKLAPQMVELAPGASKAVSWPYMVAQHGSQITFEFEAAAGEARDQLKIVQKLEPALLETVLQSTLERVDGKLSMPVEQAKGSLPETGGVTVRLERSLAANLAAVRKHMEEYPYDCLEQRTSKAVALRDQSRWKGIALTLPAYIDSRGLLKYFPEAIHGSDTLTTYVLSIANEAGYAIPESLAPKIIGGLKGFVTGTSYDAGFVYPAADLSLRKLAAMEALSRYGSFDPAWLGLIQIEPELWPVRALIDWYNLLRREQKIPEREKRLAHVQQILRAKVEWRGTVIGFKSEPQLWWLMSSMDESANRFLLAASTDEHFAEDIGRVVRGSIGRQNHGHWDLTTANAWGVLAMERFSENHEKEAVSGKSVAELDGKKQETNWAGTGSVPPMQFAWPKGKATLSVSHSGAGKPWALLTATAAVKLSEPIFKGYQLKRTVAAVEQKVKGKWSNGDVYRVTLQIEAPADMTWVAVSDPIPAGATVLGSGLGNDSAFLTKGEKQKGFTWGTIEERSFSGFRSFHEWMPKGHHQVEYTVRLNAPGTFQLPNSRVEAMYAPEMYAEAPNDELVVQP